MLLAHAKVLAAEQVYRTSDPQTKYPKDGPFTAEQMKLEDWEPVYPDPPKPDGDCGCDTRPTK